MRIPRGKDQGNSGYYGGFGSKPAAKVWTPGRQAPKAVPVGERRKRVRLRRTRRARFDGDDTASRLAGVVVFGIVLLILVPLVITFIGGLLGMWFG